MTRDQIARNIYTRSYLKGIYKLRSGKVSTYYIDKYLFESSPKLLRSITEAMVPLVPPGTALLGGMELGGVPLATMLSQLTLLPTRFIRKIPKTYGTCQLVEGGYVEGLSLLLIEDSVSSGGQIIESTNALRDLGAQITHALCVVDREQGGIEALAKIGVTLLPLFCISEIIPQN